MNVLLWILQMVLALFTLAGGAYKVVSIDEWASARWYSAIPRGGWGAVGVFEVVCALLLVVPGAVKRLPFLTPLAAAALAIEGLAVSGLYARYSLALTAANPLVWSLVLALLAAFVAYGRYTLRSSAARPAVAH